MVNQRWYLILVPLILFFVPYWCACTLMELAETGQQYQISYRTAEMTT